jgi:hypothetical protein
LEWLIETGLVKRKGKQRLDSTHVLGYVKEMSRLECAVETMRLGLEALAAEVAVGARPEFWDRFWALYVQSKLDWRLSKADRQSRYRQCGQDIRELLEWLDTHHRKLSELKGVKLLRRVFSEQFGSLGQVYHHSKWTSRYLLPPAALTRFIGWRTIRPTVVK